MSSVVIASTTAQLRISAGRQVSVIWWENIINI
jgi:hypothetical protein